MIPADANAMFDYYYKRYSELSARGADHPTSGFPADMDRIRLELNSAALAMQTWTGAASRLNDLVASTMKRIQPSIEKIESKFVKGTHVVPGSTVHVPFRMGETSQILYTPDELAEKAPEGIAQKIGIDLIQEAPWYFWNGIDLRVIGAVVVGSVTLLWVWRKKRF